jgi:ABC-type multidrug transport system ATPase subunit
MVEPIVKVEHLYLNYGKQRVVDDVSFEMLPGRIVALLGPNGAGKSSIMRIMAGLVKADRGHIYLKDRQIHSFREIHDHAGFFIEGPDFYKNLTAAQNLKLLLKIHGSDQSIENLLEQVGLTYASGKKVRKFSKGMKQRLGIAQALIGDPSILVLDEPFNGLDPEVKQFLMNMIKTLATENDKSIMISSHLLSDLEMLADDFILLSDGHVHVAGQISDFKSERQTVSFWFEKEPPHHLLETAAPGKMIGIDPWCWQTKLTITETAEIVGMWADAGHAPFEIQRADLLQTKYMEII